MVSIVYKYPVYAHPTKIRSGKIIHFGEDYDGTPSVWIYHTDNNHELIELYIVGTGMNFPDTHPALMSYVTPQGFVWHLIEKLDN